MITSLFTSLFRVTIFWYIIGLGYLFLGDPAWAEALYKEALTLPWVPHIPMYGLGSAAAVQINLMLYWTLPVLSVWAASFVIGLTAAEVHCRYQIHKQKVLLRPAGQFWGVSIDKESLGSLPESTTPPVNGQKVVFKAGPSSQSGAAVLKTSEKTSEAIKMLTPAELGVCEELLQLLVKQPHHFAGLGHGVGLLEHTLNVAEETADKVTSEFRMPLLAAFAHDVGKLITFRQDEDGEWVRKGLHSRESARILATLPSFQALPELHQRALLLAVKYDHAPNKMPEMRGDRDAKMLAMRTISALSQADRSATAAEKDRNLEKLQPEELLWLDFINNFREAPVIERGKKGGSNQVNNPPDSQFIFLYEQVWREAAIKRLPPEVAAALDLNRRDSGKIAKYTKILTDRLIKEGVLLTTHMCPTEDGHMKERTVAAANPLWDIQSGTGEKAQQMRGVIVLVQAPLWKKLNYKISTTSPFAVTIMQPNANAAGKVNAAHDGVDSRSKAVSSDEVPVGNLDTPERQAEVGFSSEASAKPKVRKISSGPKEVAPVVVEVAVLPANIPGLSDEPVKGPAAIAVDAGTDSSASENVAEVSVDEFVEPTEDIGEPDNSTDSALALFESMGMGVSTATQDEPVEAESETEAVADAVEADAEPVEVEAVEATTNPSVTPLFAPPGGLMRSQRSHGLEVADDAAVARYPHLVVGQLYFVETAKLVKNGTKVAGQAYTSADEKTHSTKQPEQKPVQATPNATVAPKPITKSEKTTATSASAIGLSSGTDVKPKRTGRRAGYK